MKKKLLGLLGMSALFAVALSGCGGGVEGHYNTTRADNEIQIFIANGNYFTDIKKDSVWTTLEERIGATLEIQGYTHGDDYYVTLNPKLNGGNVDDYPDVIFAVPDVSTAYVRWADQKTGVLQDVGELLQKYPGEYPYLEAIVFGEQYRNLVYAGAHTLIPFITQPSGWGIYYRSDWLVNVGEVNEDGTAKVPVTLEDFERVMDKFRNNDPDGNGQKDTYAMSPGMLPHFMNPLYHAFGVSVDYDINDKGEVEYFYATEEYRNFLRWMRTCYEREFIDPQYNVNTGDADRRHFEEGRTGIIITNAEEHVTLLMDAFESKQGENKVIMGPAPVGTAKLGKEGACGFSNWGGFWGGFSITLGCNEAKTKNILKLFDYLYSPEGSLLKYAGVAGTHYTLNADGSFTPNLENRKKEPTGTWVTSKDENGRDVPTGQWVLGGNFGSGYYKWSEKPADGYPTFTIMRDYLTTSPHFGAMMQQANEYAKTLKTSKLLNVTSYSAEALTVTQKLLDLATVYAIQSVQGQKDLDGGWTEYMDSLNAAGYASNIEEVTRVARELGILA